MKKSPGEKNWVLRPPLKKRGIWKKGVFGKKRGEKKRGGSPLGRPGHGRRCSGQTMVKNGQEIVGTCQTWSNTVATLPHGHRNGSSMVRKWSAMAKTWSKTTRTGQAMVDFLFYFFFRGLSSMFRFFSFSRGFFHYPGGRQTWSDFFLTSV